MMNDPAKIWLIIALLGVGTYLIRFSFLGLIGDRPIPPFITRLLRFTPVAILPAMVAPLVIWPSATGGQTEPVRLIAALVTVVVGLTTRKVILSLVVGAVVFELGLHLL
ncbi:AzlD domain-containing protein [Marivivens donghaensis]|uniref:AzlD domain-containing protein n=1 Tax=Marivivens donghaensis TaxID=1699413 RepID=A0ABX0W2C3_9RHOB|nr:AzlD domain-containing protein [Marivivens donghaensis]NIY73562.1 AzlD domain-containing protein [Marivivens donghaensis]